MSENKLINVTSEIGKLKKVLLHRPGKELENLTPDVLERLLFDDIPYLKIAQEEHDEFANIMRRNGVEVLYLEHLAAESIKDTTVRSCFVEEFIQEARIKGEQNIDCIKDYFETMSEIELVEKMMAGIRKTEFDGFKPKTLGGMVQSIFKFIYTYVFRT